MEQKCNFDETIHVVDYKAGFEKFKTGSFSLMAVEGRDKESLAGRWNFMKLAARKPARLVLPDEGGNDYLIL